MTADAQPTTARILWTDDALKRRVPRPAPGVSKPSRLTVDRLWAQVRGDYAKIRADFTGKPRPNVTHMIEPGMPRYEAAAEALAVLLADAPPQALDADVEGVIATAMGVGAYWSSPVRAGTIDTLLAYWGAHGGPAFALDAMLAALRWRLRRDGGTRGHISLSWNIAWESPHKERVERPEQVPGPWANLRAWLSTLTAQDFAAARARAEVLRSEAPELSRRSALAYAFGDAGWAREDLVATLASEAHNHGASFLAMACPPGDAGLLIELVTTKHPQGPRLPVRDLPTVVDALGEQAPGVIDAMWRRGWLEVPRKSKSKTVGAEIEAAVAEAIGLVECAESAAWLARHLDSVPCARAVAAFAERSPSVFLGPLLEAADQGASPAVLDGLIQQHAAALDAWRGPLTAAQAALLNARVGAGPAAGPPIGAAPPQPAAAPASPPAKVPAWLNDPPRAWRKKKAPAFWSAAASPALELRAGGVLSNAQLEAVRMLLAQVKDGAPPPQVAELQALCTPTSLDAFGAALIDAWIGAGGLGGDRWALFGGRLLLDPSPPTLAAVDARYFRGKVWYVYGALKSATSKQLSEVLAARGARVVSSVSSKVNFLVQPGETPAPGTWLGVAAEQAQAAGAEVVGEPDFLKLLAGRMPGAAPEPAPLAPTAGLETLRALLHDDAEPLRSWFRVREAIDAMEGDAQGVAIDYVDQYLDSLDEATQRRADLGVWRALALKGDNQPQLRLARSAVLDKINGKLGAKLLSCTHLSGLLHLGLSNNPLPLKFWPMLAAAGHLKGLRSLALAGTRIDRKGAEALASAPWTSTIRTLNLAGLQAEVGALDALFADGAWSGLEEFVAPGVQAVDTNLHRVLAASPHLRLRTLSTTTRDSESSPQDWVALLASPALADLRDLRLTAVNPDASHLALARAPMLGRLRRLRINGNSGTGAYLSGTLGELLRAPALSGLVELDLRLLQDRHLHDLFSTGHLEALELLHLDTYFVDEFTDVTCMARGHLPALRRLELGTRELTEAFPDVLLADNYPALESMRLSRIEDDALQRVIDGMNRPGLRKLDGYYAGSLGGVFKERFGFLPGG